MFQRIISILSIEMLCILFFFGFAAHSGYSQEKSKQPATESTSLELDKSVKRGFADGAEKHIYQITLTAGQYILVTISQHGVDVTVNLLGGADGGQPISQFEADSRLEGQETVEFVAKENGNYRLSVAPRYKKLITGNYEIKLAVLQPSSEIDRLQQQTRDIAAEGYKLYQSRKYDEAIAETDRARVALEKSGDTKSIFYGLIVKREGNILFDKGDYPPARERFLQAAKVLEDATTADDPRVSDTLNNLATLYNVTGEYEKSESLFLRILTNQQKSFGENYPAVTTVLNNLANLYRRKGEYAKAETMHLRSLAIREKIYGSEQPELLFPLAGLATLYYEKKDFLKSKEMDERALKIGEKSFDKDDPALLIYLNNLALINTELGDYAKAEPMFNRALAITEKAFGKDSIKLTDILNNLGELYAYTGDYDKSDAFYQRGLSILEKSLPANHPNIAGIIGNMASNCLFRGQFAKAEPLLQKQLTMREISLGSEHPDVAKTLNSLARLYENTGDTAKAVDYQSRVDQLLEKYNRLNLYAGSEAQQLAYFDYLAQQTDQLITMQLRFSDNSATRDLAVTAILQRKGRLQDILADSISALRQRLNPKDQKLLNDLSETNAKLAELVTGGAVKDIQSERERKIKELTGQKDGIENEISRLSAGFYTKDRTFTLAALQAKIPSDAVLIEFAVYQPFNLQTVKAADQYGKPRYIAYIIHQQGAVSFKDLGDAAQINEAVDALRNALRDPQNKNTARLSGAVYGKILQPIRALLGDAKQLLVSPDGELNLIPFEALVDEQNRYLIENYSFTYLTSGRDLLRMQTARTGNSKPLLIAGPQFGVAVSEQTAAVNKERKLSSKRRSVTATRNMTDTYFAPISGTLQEARSIQTLFPDAKLLIAEQATETALKQANAPEILHIATHGFFLEDKDAANNKSATATRDAKPNAESENPLLRSGLALAGANQHKTDDGDDGILTALEASGLNLWGTKLVVLSACDTGLGDVKNGEGVYGLRRAFVLAGTESLVMSLWAVSDSVTRELMTNYYKNLKAGMGRGAALREVQLQMLKSKNRQHPFYWAAFIQSGEWANLEGKR